MVRRPEEEECILVFTTSGAKYCILAPQASPLRSPFWPFFQRHGKRHGATYPYFPGAVYRGIISIIIGPSLFTMCLSRGKQPVEVLRKRRSRSSSQRFLSTCSSRAPPNNPVTSLRCNLMRSFAYVAMTLCLVGFASADWLSDSPKLCQASWAGDLELLEERIAAGDDVNE